MIDFSYCGIGFGGGFTGEASLGVFPISVFDKAVATVPNHS
jgi:hypothetical protein